MPEATDARAIHALPFRTTFSGTTDIVRVFSAGVGEDADGRKQQQLRGRSLVGVEVAMPESYSLMAVRHLSTESSTTTTEKRPQVVAASNKFILWGHDVAPENPHALKQWISLAHAIHDSSSDEEA